LSSRIGNIEGREEHIAARAAAPFRCAAEVLASAAVEEVILVDEFDREIGHAEKLEAHRGGGRLHRAFSIVLFDAAGRMLLQRRATSKYHFGGLWTNACCGHPRRGEEVAQAARRRLREELGVEVPLREAFSFSYTASDARSGFTEREFDHVFVGLLEGEARPDPREIDALRWADCGELAGDLRAQPERYTPWFGQLVARLPELAAEVP
jgi:isopentenyl-diphosphate delta-isomerase